MRILDFQTFTYQNGVAGLLTPVSGDDNQLKSFTEREYCRLLSVFITSNGNAGNIRIKSPRLHDPFKGIQLTPGDASYVSNVDFLPKGIRQEFKSGDRLDLEYDAPFQGNVGMLLYYSDTLVNGNTQFIDSAELERRGKNWKTAFFNLTVGPNDGVYNPMTAPGFNDGLFHEESYYALIGSQVCTVTPAVGFLMRLRAPETANINIPLPMCTELIYGDAGRNYFPALSDRYKLPLIPIIWGRNIPLVQIEGIGSADVERVQLNFVELGKP